MARKTVSLDRFYKTPQPMGAKGKTGLRGSITKDMSANKIATPMSGIKGYNVAKAVK